MILNYTIHEEVPNYLYTTIPCLVCNALSAAQTKIRRA